MMAATATLLLAAPVIALAGCRTTTLAHFCGGAQRAGPVGNCLACASSHQAQLKKAGCSSTDITAFCNSNPPATGRGFGDGVQRGKREDLQLLSGLSWWYNWGLSPGPIFGDEFGQEFVAMVWGSGVVPELESWSPHPSTTALLGFNEPNLYTQANLTAAAACALWQPVLTAAKKHKLHVGSPAANHCKPTTKPQPS